MHELAVTQNIISIIESEAKKQGFKRCVTIRLKVGEVSGVIPECLYEFFPIASKDTIAEGAEFMAEAIPVRVRCEDCGWEAQSKAALCPECGGGAIRLVSGREFFVDSIEVE